MFDPTYKELIEKGFKETRLLKSNLSFPEYMQLNNNETRILTEHLGEGLYAIHRMYNRYGRHYSPIDIISDPKFENISSLDDLISFLSNDNEPCELNPPYSI